MSSGNRSERTAKWMTIAGITLILSMGIVGCGGGGESSNRSGNEETGTQAETGQAPTGDAQTGGPETHLANTPDGGKGSASPAQTPVPHQPVVYRLQAGSAIRVRTTSTISTHSHHSGQEFVASLVEPLVVDGEVLALRGAEVIGRVVHSDPGGRVKGVASISLSLASLQLANGGVANLQTSIVGRNAQATRKRDAAKIGIGSGVGAAVGAIAGGGKGAAIGAAAGGGAGTGVVLATRGEPAVFPAETMLTFTIREPLLAAF